MPQTIQEFAGAVSERIGDTGPIAYEKWRVGIWSEDECVKEDIPMLPVWRLTAVTVCCMLLVSRL